VTEMFFFIPAPLSGPPTATRLSSSTGSATATAARPTLLDRTAEATGPGCRDHMDVSVDPVPATDCATIHICSVLEARVGQERRCGQKPSQR
jgi:hypothetical protein